MSATWYLIQYMPDLRRRENRNVGLALQTPRGWYTRFLGEQPDGRIDGRSVAGKQIDPEVYRTWVSYYRRKAHTNSWPDVDRFQAHKSGNYHAELGGHILQDEDDWENVLTQLYNDLVETIDRPEGASKVEAADYINTAVWRVLQTAGVEAEQHVKVSAKWRADGPLTTVPFRFSFTNGHQHLMDVVYTHVTPDRAAVDARDLRARMDAVERVTPGQHFISFYASSIVREEHLSEVLMPVEEVSLVVDVDSEQRAVEAVQEIVMGS